MEILIYLFIFTLLFSTTKSRVTDSNYGVFEEVRVGLVVDLGSVQGKILKTSFTLALSDFYGINSEYRTRVSVLVRDSRGDPLLALAAAKNLVKKARVEVIVGAQSLQEAKLLAAFSDKTKHVVVSPLVPSSLSLNKHSHFIQWTHDRTSEAKGIASLVHDIACILAIVVEKRSLIRATSTRSDASEGSWNVSDLVKLIKHSRRLNGDIQINERTEERRVGLRSDGSFSKRSLGRSDVTRPRHRFLAENGVKKKLLRVLVPSGNRVPNLVRVTPDPETGVVTVTGLCMEIFKTCMEPLKYELEFIPYTGSYDNLAYLLSTQRDKYDAAAGDLTITSNRSSYVEFTLPFTDIGIGALALKKKKPGMWTFFDPFEKPLWLASGAFFILTGLVVWLVERPVNPEFQGSWKQQLGTMLWFGFSTIVFAHREKLQKMSSRFLVIVWMFVVLILTASYSANLTSTKTISRIQLDHNQLSFGPSMMKISNSINAIEAYAQVLRNGTLTHVVDEIPYLNILLGQYPDVFAMTDREAITNGFGFMFQKGSGLAPKVSREIATLRTSGTLKDMEKRWFQKLDSLYVHSNDNDDDEDDASNRFTFGELGGLFIIAGAAHALVLVMHLFQTRQEILRVLCESRLFTKLKNAARVWRC